LECNTNVPSVSRIWPEYFPIGYKMMPNLAFSSRWHSGSFRHKCD